MSFNRNEDSKTLEEERIDNQPLGVPILETQRKLTIRTVFKEIFDWYPSSLPSEERRLLFKLDLSILIYGCLTFFVKFLDQTNLTNAYVSGMKEDLNIHGNELNYLNQFYYSGYVVAQIPMLLLMSRPKLARFWLPGLEILYGILTFCEAKVTRVNQLYALRFFIGVFEAPTFAGMHFVFGAWYRPNELFRRAGTWFICNSLGSMFSGYLQSAAYTKLMGVAGMKGWQWLFIIDGIITIPVAIFGLVVFPGIPDSPKTLFFSDSEIALAKARLGTSKTAGAGRLNLDVAIRTLKRWRWWVGVAIYICLIQSSYGTSYMVLWLETLPQFSVPQINNIPSGLYALTALSSWLGTSLAPIFGPAVIWTFAETWMLFNFICLLIWNIPYGLKFFNWITFGVQGCVSPVLYSFINVACRGDAEERALVMSSMMAIGYSEQIWLPLFTFPTVKAPRWKAGWAASIGFTVAMWLFQMLALTLYKRDERRKRVEDEQHLREPVPTTASGILLNSSGTSSEEQITK